MKRVALSLIVFLAALLSACVAPTDFSDIKVGATRATVEGVLGKPVKNTQTDSGRIDTYKYNRGAAWSGDGLVLDPGTLVIVAFGAPIIQGIVYTSQRRDIEVAYGPDDTVVELGWGPGSIEEAREEARAAEKEREKLLVAAEKGDREAQFRLASLSSSVDEQRKWLSLAANQGHAEAQFQLYYRASRPSGKSLTWLCLAANQGYAPAQEMLGKLHAGFFSGKYSGDWSDAGFAEPDRVRAYMWHSLTASSWQRRAGYFRDALADQMTPEQIAEAEKLAAEWKPGDCGAEDRTAKSNK